MSRMMEMAKDLGKALAQTDEYQILKVAVSSTEDDGEMADLRTELEGLEQKIEAALQAGISPGALKVRAHRGYVALRKRFKGSRP